MEKSNIFNDSKNDDNCTLYNYRVTIGKYRPDDVSSKLCVKNFYSKKKFNVQKLEESLKNIVINTEGYKSFKDGDYMGDAYTEFTKAVLYKIPYLTLDYYKNLAENHLNEFIEDYKSYQEFYLKYNEVQNYLVISDTEKSVHKKIYNAIKDVENIDDSDGAYWKIFEVNINWNKVKEKLFDDYGMLKEETIDIDISDIWKSKKFDYKIAVVCENDIIPDDSIVNRKGVEKFIVPSKEWELKDLLYMNNYIFDLIYHHCNYVQLILSTSLLNVAEYIPLFNTKLSMLRVSKKYVDFEQHKNSVCKPSIKSINENECIELVKLLKILNIGI